MLSDKQFMINKALGSKRVAEKKRDTAYNTKAHSKALHKAKGIKFDRGDIDSSAYDNKRNKK